MQVSALPSHPALPLPQPSSPFSPVTALSSSQRTGEATACASSPPSCQILDEFVVLLSLVDEATGPRLRNLVDKRGRNPLFDICASGNIYLLRILLSQNKRPKFSDADFLAKETTGDQRTALMVAAASRCHQAHRCCELLLRSFPSLLAMRDAEGRSCLEWSIIGGEPVNIAAILKHADTALLEGKWAAGGETPLMLASYLGHARAVESLLLLGADINKRSGATGLSALDFALVGEAMAADQGGADIATGPLPVALASTALAVLTRGSASDYSLTVAALRSAGAERSNSSTIAARQIGLTGSGKATDACTDYSHEDNAATSSPGSLLLSFSFLGKLLRPQSFNTKATPKSNSRSSSNVSSSKSSSGKGEE